MYHPSIHIYRAAKADDYFYFHSKVHVFQFIFGDFVHYLIQIKKSINKKNHFIFVNTFTTQ